MSGFHLLFSSVQSKYSVIDGVGVITGEIYVEVGVTTGLGVEIGVGVKPMLLQLHISSQ